MSDNTRKTSNIIHDVADIKSDVSNNTQNITNLTANLTTLDGAAVKKINGVSPDNNGSITIEDGGNVTIANSTENNNLTLTVDLSPYTTTDNLTTVNNKAINLSASSGVKVTQDGNTTGNSTSDKEWKLEANYSEIKTNINLALNDLSDVSNTTASNGQVLTYNGSTWTAANSSGGGNSTSGVTSLNNLSGTLTLESSNSTIDISKNGSSNLNLTLNASLNELNNVIDTGTVSQNQVLTYNGTNWTNQNASGGTFKTINSTAPDGSGNFDIINGTGINATVGTNNLTLECTVQNTDTDTLSELTDTTIGTLVDDQFLRWSGDATTGKWVNETVSLAPSNAQQNVQSNWDATEGDALILNKPTNLSDFSNDSGFITTDTDTGIVTLKSGVETVDGGAARQVEFTSSDSSVQFSLENNTIDLQVPAAGLNIKGSVDYAEPQTETDGSYTDTDGNEHEVLWLPSTYLTDSGVDNPAIGDLYVVQYTGSAAAGPPPGTEFYGHGYVFGLKSDGSGEYEWGDAGRLSGPPGQNGTSISLEEDVNVNSNDTILTSTGSFATTTTPGEYELTLNIAPSDVTVGNLSELSDVCDTDPTDKQVLAWDNANSTWCPDNPTAKATLPISDLLVNPTVTLDGEDGVFSVTIGSQERVRSSETVPLSVNAGLTTTGATLQKWLYSNDPTVQDKYNLDLQQDVGSSTVSYSFVVTDNGVTAEALRIGKDEIIVPSQIQTPSVRGLADNDASIDLSTDFTVSHNGSSSVEVDSQGRMKLMRNAVISDANFKTYIQFNLDASAGGEAFKDKNMMLRAGLGYMVVNSDATVRLINNAALKGAADSTAEVTFPSDDSFVVSTGGVKHFQVDSSGRLKLSNEDQTGFQYTATIYTESTSAGNSDLLLSGQFDGPPYFKDMVRITSDYNLIVKYGDIQVDRIVGTAPDSDASIELGTNFTATAGAGKYQILNSGFHLFDTAGQQSRFTSDGRFLVGTQTPDAGYESTIANRRGDEVGVVRYVTQHGDASISLYVDCIPEENTARLKSTTNIELAVTFSTIKLGTEGVSVSTNDVERLRITDTDIKAADGYEPQTDDSLVTKGWVESQRPPLPPAQIQSDWNEDDFAKESYIFNKPTSLSQFTNDLDISNEIEYGTPTSSTAPDSPSGATLYDNMYLYVKGSSWRKTALYPLDSSGGGSVFPIPQPGQNSGEVWVTDQFTSGSSVKVNEAAVSRAGNVFYLANSWSVDGERWYQCVWNYSGGQTTQSYGVVSKQCRAAAYGNGLYTGHYGYSYDGQSWNLYAGNYQAYGSCFFWEGKHWSWGGQQYFDGDGMVSNSNPNLSGNVGSCPIVKHSTDTLMMLDLMSEGGDQERGTVKRFVGSMETGSWQQQGAGNADFLQNVYGIAWDGLADIWVFITNSKAYVQKTSGSFIKSNFDEIELPTNSTWAGLTHDGNRFVAIAKTAGANVSIWSEDGRTWTASNNLTNPGLNNVAGFNGRVIGAGAFR